MWESLSQCFEAGLGIRRLDLEPHKQKPDFNTSLLNSFFFCFRNLRLNPEFSQKISTPSTHFFTRLSVQISSDRMKTRKLDSVS